MPPVTALRSPPLSRITGALSPVIALSLTEATPSITSPSPGIVSPASTSTRSSLRSSVDGTASRAASRRASRSFFATTSRRALRSASACALPRPSAIASAKFANSTVNQSQTETARMKPAGASPAPVTSAWKTSSVVNALPTSTTNITGFRIMWRGSSLRSESTIARCTIGASKSGRDWAFADMSPPGQFENSIRCSTIGPSASAGKKVSAPTSTTVPASSETNSGPCVGSVPAVAGTSFFAASEPAIARIGTMIQ